jgi:CheY-like chemotaxis protein
MARILIVEGDQFFADALAFTLELDGHRVAVADSAGEAVRRGVASHPDVVVAAWNLKGTMHGGEVCRRIRAVWPSTKAVVITGVQECAFETGESCECVAAVLSKPFHRDEILDAVRQALVGKVVVGSAPLAIPSFSERSSSYHLLNLG